MKYNRNDQKREDGLSSSLQVAKAAEHLVCFKLIKQGFNVFLSDAGLPYDLVVDLGNGKFSRVQVKATCEAMSSRKNSVSVYRFAVRKGRVINRFMKLDNCDYLALVALDIEVVGFIPVEDMIREDGFSKQSIEFKSRSINYERVSKTGPDPSKCGKFLEDYQEFKIGSKCE